MNARKMVQDCRCSVYNANMCLWSTLKIVDKHQYRCTSVAVCSSLFCHVSLRYTMCRCCIEIKSRFYFMLALYLFLCDCYYYRSSSSCWTFSVWMLSPSYSLFSSLHSLFVLEQRRLSAVQCNVEFLCRLQVCCFACVELSKKEKKKKKHRIQIAIT